MIFNNFSDLVTLMNLVVAMVEINVGLGSAMKTNAGWCGWLVEAPPILPRHKALHDDCGRCGNDAMGGDGGLGDGWLMEFA